MKKICVILFCLILPAAVFAETEFWGTLGFQYGSSWEKYYSSEGTAKSWLGSPGFVLNAYAFFNKKNIGLFVNNSFLFPNNSLYEFKDQTLKNYVLKNHVKEQLDDRFLYQLGIGPVFKYAVTDNLILHTGAGLNLSVLYAKVDRPYSPVHAKRRIKMKVYILSLGIMGDAGLKYNITRALYFDVGTKLTLDFAQHNKRTSNLNRLGEMRTTSKWEPKYIGFHLMPYLGIGINLPH